MYESFVSLSSRSATLNTPELGSMANFPYTIERGRKELVSK